MMVVQRESNDLVFRLYMRVEAIIPVDQLLKDFPWSVFLMTTGDTYPKEPAREVSYSSGERRSFSL